MNELNTLSKYHAKAHGLHISSRKMNLVCSMIKERAKKNNENVMNSLQVLDLCNKKAARMLYEVVKSAVSNGIHNYKISPTDLYIESIWVGKHMILKRLFCRARGRADMKKKHYCSVTVNLKMREI